MQNKNNTPHISVIIPLYNKAAHIVDTINAVLQQTHRPFEIIVVDDGSTDGSADRVKSMTADNIVIIEQQNGGVSSARNTGVFVAKSDYVAFIDADDHWAPHFLEEIAKLIQAYPSAALYATNYQLNYQSNNKNNRFVTPHIAFTNKSSDSYLMQDFFDIGAQGMLPFTASSFACDKKVLACLGNFPVNEAMGEDQEVFAQFALFSQIAYSPKVLSFYRQDADNRACQSNVPEQECPFSQRLSMMANSLISHRQQRISMLAFSAAHLLHLARENMQRGNFTAAKRLLNDQRTHYLPKKKALGILRYAYYWLRGQLMFDIRPAGS